MQKLIGIILIVVGIWVGLEIYTNGMDGAFGGIFASISGGEAPQVQQDAAPSAPKAHSSVVQRAGDRVQSHIDQGEARINEQVEEE